MARRRRAKDQVDATAVAAPHSSRPTAASTSRQPDTLRSIYYALGANVAVALIKFAGAAFTGSGSLLAEGLHSVADSGNEALLLLGRKQARRPPSVRHPLGHGRATYFWSFIVAVLLFSVGGMLSVAEGYYKLRHASAVDMPWVAVVIVVLAMVAEGISLRVTLRQVAKVQGDLSLYRWFRTTRRSQLLVVVSEDLAAIAGLAIAFAALIATSATGDTVYDAWGTLGIGALLIVAATLLANEIKSLLIGESAPPRTRRAIREFLDGQPHIAKICDVLTVQQGEQLMIVVRARLDSALTAPQLLALVASIKTALQDRFPQAGWVSVEPVGAVPTARRRRERLQTVD